MYLSFSVKITVLYLKKRFIMNGLATLDDEEYTFWRELRDQARSAIPLSLTQLIYVARMATDTVFLGHLGEDALAGQNLAALFYIAITAFFLAVVGGCAPLCAQAHGARKPRLMCLWFQMGVLSIIALSFVMVPCMIYGMPFLLRVCDLTPQAHEYAIQYITVVAFAFPFEGVLLLEQTFLTSQDLMEVPSLLGMVSVGLNAVLNYLMIYGIPGYWAGLGFIGSPLTNVFTTILQLLFLMVYHSYSTSVPRLPSWRIELLLDWKKFSLLFEQVLGVLIAEGTEQWSFAILSFMVGALGTTAVSSFSVSLNHWFIIWAVNYGVGMGAQIRVAQFFGARKASLARQCFWAGMVICFITNSILGTGYLFGALWLGRIYTDVEVILKNVENVRYYVIASFFSSTYNILFSFVLSACNRNQKAGWISALSYIGVQIPLVYILTFRYSWGLPGVWIGCLTSETVRMIGAGIGVWFLDFEEEAHFLSIQVAEHGGHMISPSPGRTVPYPPQKPCMVVPSKSRQISPLAIPLCNLFPSSSTNDEPLNGSECYGTFELEPSIVNS